MRELSESVIFRPSEIATPVRGSAELVRGLGLWSTTAIVIGNVIGTAVFLVGSEAARAAGSAPLSLAAWVVGGLLALCGALCLGELGAAMPRAGGIYAYLTRGLGPAWGFLYGWTSSTVVETAANAALAAGFLRLVGFLVPAASTPLSTFTFPLAFQTKTYEFAFTTAQPLAAGVIVLITAINYLSVRSGGRIQLLATSLKVGAVAALIALGFVSQRSNFANLLPSSTPLAAGACVPHCARPSHVGLQRMALAWRCGRRSGKSRKKHSAGTRPRNACRRRYLHFGELGLPARAGFR